MGWTSYHASEYRRGNVNRKAECDKLWIQTEHDGYPELKVLKSTMKGSTYYAAVQNVTKGVTFGVVVLTNVNSKDYYNFAYKEMDETCGPGQSECPDSILKLLSPTDSEYALAWRKRCAEFNAKKKAKLTPATLPVGTTIRFKLWNGEERTLKKMPPAYQYRRNWWYVVGQHASYPARRIPDEYEIVKEV